MQRRLLRIVQCSAIGIAAYAFLLVPTYGQIRQISPEVQRFCQVFPHVEGVQPALASALSGESEAFLKLGQHLDGMRTVFEGNLPLSFDPLRSLASNVDFFGKIVLKNETLLLTTQKALLNATRESLALVSQAQEVAEKERSTRQAYVRIDAAQQIINLLKEVSIHTGVIARQGIAPEAFFNLGAGINSFNALTRGLLHGDTQLKMPAVTNVQQHARISKLIQDFNPIRANAGKVIFNLQAYISVHTVIEQLQNSSNELNKVLLLVCHTLKE